jgi:hypothetical protein
VNDNPCGESQVDYLFVGGALAVQFLAASGIGVGGSSLLDDACMPIVKHLLRKASRSKVTLVLPVDVVVGEVLASKHGCQLAVEETDEADEDEDDSEPLEGQSGRTDGASLSADPPEANDPAAGYDYDFEVKHHVASPSDPT